jgi:hypothetical protein
MSKARLLLVEKEEKVGKSFHGPFSPNNHRDSSFRNDILIPVASITALLASVVCRK